VICEVCSAPAVPLDGACVFCRSPLENGLASASNLLDYLGERVSSARVRRGFFDRGPVRQFEVEAGGEKFSAWLRSEELKLRPDLELPLWVDRLLAGLSRDAAADAGLRSAMTRAGWRLR
jgi:hypothetical protein